MKSFINIFSILLVATNISYSQHISVVIENQTQPEFSDELLTARYVGADFKEMRLQFAEDWQRGDIVLLSGKVVSNQFIRLNNYSNELAWLREPDFKIGILMKESIKEFSYYSNSNMPERTYRKMLLTKSFIESDKETFVQVLVENEDTVICHRKYNKVGNTDEYKISNQFYLLRNGDFSRFYLQRSSIFSLFENEERQKIKSIIRSNHLKVRKEDGMIRAFELFYE